MADADHHGGAGLTPLPSASGGTFAPFRYPAFRAIWIANMASNLGAMIQSIAAAWLMTDLTSSHLLIALIQASTTIPVMLFGVFAGAIADNFDRRRVMLAAQTGMLIVSAALAAVSWWGEMTPLMLLAFTLAVGTGTALNSPAWQASVRQQVGMKDLPQAIALNSMSFNLARTAGPALGGLLISIWDVSLAFTVNAVSYLAMIVVLSRWKPAPRAIERKPMLPAIAVGLRFCGSSSPIRRVLVRATALCFGVTAYQALLPSVARERLHGGELDFGLLLGMFGIGSIAAAPFIGKLRRRWGMEGVLAAGTLSCVAGQSLLATAATVQHALPAAFLGGAGWVTGMTSLNVAMQMRSPEAILGRCMSIYQAIAFGGMAVGAWLWGMLADLTDLAFSLHVASVFLLVSLVVLRRLAPMPKPGEGRVDAVPEPRAT